MIITLILIFFTFIVGVAFFSLSKKYKKNKYVYVLLGVLSFIIGVSMYIIIYISVIDLLPNINRYIHEFLCLITGGLGSLLYYSFLEKRWKTNN